MEHITKIFIILYCSFCYGQMTLDEIKMLEGIWIAEDYYNSFEKTNSAIKSRESFQFNYPAGLRINSNEIKNGILNIGYAELHNHLLFPEISDYIVKNKDTIHEQGSFKVNLTKKDSIGYYKTTDISYFNYDWISYLSWNNEKTSLILYRPKRNQDDEKYIRYKRVVTEFNTDYPFPNPLYYYTRSKTLTGNYTLKDNLGNILSDDLNIGKNGIVTGFELLDNFTAYFSTDVYCGYPQKYDLLMLFENILNNESKFFHFLYVKNKNGNINLFERVSKLDEESYALGDKVYELIKN